MNKSEARDKKEEKKPPLCLNCDAVMEEPDLFCKRLCTDEAKFVRSMRRWISQGRETDPDIIETRKVMLAHILSGGYPRREREIPPAVSQAVKERAKGMCERPGCRNPGTEIDHIRGNSSDLNNLQYLCRDCHMKKTKSALRPIAADDPRYEEYMAKVTALTRRYKATKPLRPCDDHETCEQSWRAYKQERKLYFEFRL